MTDATKAGRPRRNPDHIFTDRPYDAEASRKACRDRGIDPRLPRRGTGRRSDLVVFR